LAKFFDQILGKFFDQILANFFYFHAFEPGNFFKEIFPSVRLLQAGLPDFSWCNVPKRQNIGTCSKKLQKMTKGNKNGREIF
jgi:hypothetical protein